MIRNCKHATIKFPTGKLLFANFFNVDELPPDESPKETLEKMITEYGNNWDLCSHEGRQNWADFYSDKFGMAYLQLGNCICSIWKVSDKRLVVTSSNKHWCPSKGADETEIIFPEEWEDLGEICCDVWRIEGIDTCRFEEHNFDIADYKKKHPHMDFVEAEVTPGKWEFKCYLTYVEEEKLIDPKTGIGIWAEFDLMEDKDD